MEGDKLYSVKEAAKYLGGVSPWTIYSWLASGKLARSKVGRRTMIRGSALERVIEDGGKSPAPRRKQKATETAAPTREER
jgi:excisionase family DNA binding protein